MTDSELVAIWQLWDRKPGDEVRARRMEDACRQFCAEHGIGSVNRFRAGLALARRSGIRYDEAIEAATNSGPIT